MGLLQGKVALVTGAAGAIGRAISRGFAREGAKLCLVDIDEARLEMICVEIGDRDGAENVLPVAADVRDPAQVRACVQHAEDRFGRLDILVNNAAVTLIRSIDEIEDKDIHNIIDTNLKGYFYCAREAVRAMKRKGEGGAIIIISSKNGLEGAADKTLYSATKGGVIVLARALARELGPFGIRANTICPDAVLEGSKFWEPGGAYSLATAARYGISESEIPRYYRERCALKVSIKPEDVAEAALFLASDKASKITGAVLTVDGGVAFVR